MRPAGLALSLCLAAGAGWAAPVETAYLTPFVQAGELPPLAERLPLRPAVATMAELGQPGGALRMLMASPKDTRILVAYSYARLIAYDRDYRLAPDLLESFAVEEGRIFTLRLRPGHKWSNGDPFTSEDFRYWWEDVANNPELSPAGPPKVMLIEGEAPKVEILDETTIRYTWSKPNAEFLPALAAAAPLYIYRPARYLKRFHARYADAAALAAAVAESGQPSWAALHNRRDNQYRNDNPKLPTLDPWVLRTKPPAERFVFVRNPYYHRVDAAGRQLPYFDQVIFDIADGKLIPAKTGAGESDLQARYIRFDNYTFLKEAERERGKFAVRLWQDGRGSTLALFPNLTCSDPVWRRLNRDVRFRRALSLAIDRHEINQAIYFGLGLEGANALLPSSPLFDPAWRSAWSGFDLAEAGRLLDAVGLTERGADGIRLLPDGRKLTVIVDTAGESTEENDVLELIKDNWRRIGVDMFVKPSQREVLRDRVFAGQSVMTAGFGIDNAFANADMSPAEFAPSTQQQLMWAKWGQYVETGGGDGEAIDLPEARQLAALLNAWREAASTLEREAIWRRMLPIWADQVYTIGTVAGVPQPVVVGEGVRNVPERGLWAFDPGGQFGIYRPDTFFSLHPAAPAPLDDPLQ